MHDRQPPLAHQQIEPPRQSRHPGAGIFIELAVGVGEPGGRQAVALAARDEAAAAMLGPARKTLLAVAHDHVHARAAHEVDGRGGIGAIGDDVAGADEAIRSNVQALGRGQQGPRRLEIAVGAAEDDCRPVQAKDRRARRDHGRFALGHAKREPKVRRFSQAASGIPTPNFAHNAQLISRREKCCPMARYRNSRGYRIWLGASRIRFPPALWGRDREGGVYLILRRIYPSPAVAPRRRPPPRGGR